MAELSEDVKRFIVLALACHDKPSQVVESVKDEFDLVVSKQRVETYDPTKHAGRNLSRKWRDLFDHARSEWRDGLTEVPIANRIHRLRVIGRVAGKAERMRNLPLVLTALEQARKECEQRVPAGKKPVGDQPAAAAPTAEYVLRPDEDVPSNPIL